MIVLSCALACVCRCSNRSRTLVERHMHLCVVLDIKGALFLVSLGFVDLIFVLVLVVLMMLIFFFGRLDVLVACRVACRFVVRRFNVDCGI